MNQASPPLPPVPAQALASPRNEEALALLARGAREDLARLNHPPPNWVLPATAPDGAPGEVTDKLVGLYRRHLASFAADPEAALQVLGG